MRLLVAALATLFILVILWDAFQTIVLSRRVVRRFRLTRAFYRLLWTPWRAVARRLPEGNRRENLLTVFGPFSLLLLMALWAIGLVVPSRSSIGASDRSCRIRTVARGSASICT